MKIKTNLILLPDEYDAYIIHGNIHNSDLYYATHFLTSDPVTYIQSRSGKGILLISDMEKERAMSESCVNEIRTTSEYNYKEKIHSFKDSEKAYVSVLTELLKGEGIKKAAVPYNFPAYIFKELIENGIDAETIKSPYLNARAVKTEKESEYIAEAMKAAEEAMKAAVYMIKKASVKDGLLYDDGEILTGERVLTEIDKTLNSYNAVGEETIVSCGKDTASPHGKTYGPLKANEPIIIDIFPMNRKTKYYGDMTRTVLKGTASTEIKKLYDAVKKAHEAALDIVKEGVTCREIHNVVCNTFESLGYDTYRNGSKVGFVHTTGHGVGLDIHELPSVSENDYILKKGNVITIEPGLYYPNIGGVRLEDTILITDTGYKNYNKMEKILETDA